MQNLECFIKNDIHFHSFYSKNIHIISMGHCIRILIFFNDYMQNGTNLLFIRYVSIILVMNDNKIGI